MPFLLALPEAQDGPDACKTESGESDVRAESRQPTPSNDYLYGLDIVRFVSALLVAAFHLSWRKSGLSGIMPFGWIGVQVFFVISGFVIANSANGRSPADFAKGRLLRLYPAAWCCALTNMAALTVSSIFLDISRPPFKSLLGSMVLVNGPFLTSAYWTLPIELVFYVVIFLLLFFRRFALLEWLAIALVIWSAPHIGLLGAKLLGARIAINPDFGYGWKNMSLLRHGLYFSVGILLWLWSQNCITRAGVIALLFSVMLAAIEISDRAVEITPRFAAMQPTTLMAISAWLAWLASCAAIAFFAVKNHLFSALPRVCTWIRSAGLVTYPLYLLHEAIGLRFMDLMLHHNAQPYVVYVAALVISICAGYVVVRWLEPPLRSLLTRALVRTGRHAVHVFPSLRLMMRHGGQLETRPATSITSPM